MQNWNKEDDFLGRWLNDALSEEEKKLFEDSEEFADFDRIAEVAAGLELEAYDTETAYQKIQSQNQSQQKRRTRTVRLQRILAIAASLVLVALVYYWIAPREKTYITQNAEKNELALPDGSSVSLHVASRISYDSRNWAEERKVSLQGEAFFEVTEGQEFLVELACGEVSVLGTSFNIRSRDGRCEITCFSGKIKFTIGEKESILEAGEGIQIDIREEKNIDIRNDQRKPAWTRGITELKEASLEEALEELKLIYNLRVILDGNLPDKKLNADIPHDDARIAIQSILEPFDIKYEFDPGKSILRVLAD